MDSTFARYDFAAICARTAFNSTSNGLSLVEIEPAPPAAVGVAPLLLPDESELQPEAASRNKPTEIANSFVFRQASVLLDTPELNVENR